MCTHFTVYYNCTHTQTSHRCPRSTTTVCRKNGARLNQVNSCNIKCYLEGRIQDDCVDCKMKRGIVPGTHSGVNAWSEWGPKEIAIAARMNKVNERFEMSALQSRAMQNVAMGGQHGSVGETGASEDWEEQVRAVLTDRVPDQHSTPETDSVMSGSFNQDRKEGSAVIKEPAQEDDEWMWGGSFGTE